MCCLAFVYVTLPLFTSLFLLFIKIVILVINSKIQKNYYNYCCHYHYLLLLLLLLLLLFIKVLFQINGLNSEIK